MQRRGRLARGTRRSGVALTLAALVGLALVVLLGGTGASASGTGGEVVSWGSNGSSASGTGQLGEGTTAERTREVPSEVEMPSGVAKKIVQVATGNSTSFALTSEGAIYGWGSNESGGAGTGAEESVNYDSPTAITLPGSEAASAVAAGTSYGLALGDNGRLYSWGWASVGRLGNEESSENKKAPVEDPEFAGQKGQLSAVAAGAAFAMAVTSEGQLYAWGSDDDGEVGIGVKEQEVLQPTLVHIPAEAEKVTKIAAGEEYALALTASGKLYAWGADQNGELGDGKVETDALSPQPVEIPAGERVTGIAAGGFTAYATTENATTKEGHIYAWGYGLLGDLGNGKIEESDKPVLVDELPGASGEVTQLSAGEFDVFALTSSGQLFSWGNDEHGELGIGSKEKHDTPQAIDAPSGTVFSDVSAAPSATRPGHTLAILSDLAITTSSLPAGGTGSSYSATLQVAGGLGPYKWSATGLPEGLTIDETTGEITGTPAKDGSPTVTVIAEDSDGVSTEAKYTLAIGAKEEHHEEPHEETKKETHEETHTTPVSIAPTTTTASTPPPTPPASEPTPAALAASRTLSCTTAQVTLIDVIPKGSRVEITGAAREVLAGKKVSIVLESTHKTVATATVQANGLFSATAPLPPSKARFSNSTKYVAKLGSLSSLALKLERRSFVDSAVTSGSQVTIRGHVTGSFRKGTAVHISLRVTCATYQTVGTVKLSATGTFTATVPAPTGAATQIALYRAGTTVLEGKHSEPTFTLPVPPS